MIPERMIPLSKNYTASGRNNMKFGIYCAYWEREWGGDAKKYIPKVKKLGFDILEVATADFAGKDDSYFRDMKNMAEDNGITLTGGYGPVFENNIGTSDPAKLEKALSFYTNMFRQMELAGITSIGGALYSYWPIKSLDFNKSEDFARSVAGMKRLAAAAEDHGITLNMESLNRFEGYLINTCEECIQYVKAVDKPNVKVMLDTFHMNIEEDSILEAIRMAGDMLGHFHVGEANRKPPRPGRMRWEEIGKALKDINYDGSVVMEPFVVPSGGVGRDIRIWREMFSDVSEKALDNEAAESVKYLREAFL